MTPLTLKLKPVLELTHEQFEQICISNPDLRLECTSKGELILMSPTGRETGGKNSSLTGQLWFWNHQTKRGKTFDSSTGFQLPNSATRSQDAAWIAQERWEALPREQCRKFAPICPDFVVELRSPTDDIEPMRAKMHEYVENGCRLEWLIDPETQRVEIYRYDRPPEVLEKPEALSAEPILPGFTLDLAEIWE